MKNTETARAEETTAVRVDQAVVEASSAPEKLVSWPDIAYDMFEALGRDGGDVFISDVRDEIWDLVEQAVEAWIVMGVLGVEEDQLLWLKTVHGLLELGGARSGGDEDSELDSEEEREADGGGVRPDFGSRGRHRDPGG